MNLNVRTHLGPYEITVFVGAGGTSEVYRARDPRLGRAVAIIGNPVAPEQPTRAVRDSRGRSGPVASGPECEN